MVTRSPARKIGGGQFKVRGRMSEYLALGDRPDTAIAIAEGTQDPDVIGVGFKPEAVLQRLDRDHAFDRALGTGKAERYAAAGKHLRFEFKGIHGSLRAIRESA